MVFIESKKIFSSLLLDPSLAHLLGAFDLWRLVWVIAVNGKGEMK